jgi:hypothetical protein
MILNSNGGRATKDWINCSKMKVERWRWKREERKRKREQQMI